MKLQISEIKENFENALKDNDIERAKHYVSMVKNLEKELKNVKYKMLNSLSKYYKEEFDPIKIYDILTNDTDSSKAN
jgi:dihydroneopterin aldolase